MQSYYPVCPASKSLLSNKLVFHTHLATIHGGVNTTMTNVRETHSIPGLRQLTKKEISKCHECKRIQSKSFTTPVPGYLPKTRAEQNQSSKAIGAHYADTIYYKTKLEREMKVYLLLFTCSVSRAIHLETLTNQTAGELIKAQVKLVARRGIPQIIYSDNAKTFTDTK